MFTVGLNINNQQKIANLKKWDYEISNFNVMRYIVEAREMEQTLPK